MPAPETWEAIRKAAITAGTLMNRRNWSIESMKVVPQGASGASSVRPLRRALIVREKLVGIGRPGHREQRKNRDEGQRFHDASVGSDCGQKRQSSAHFQDEHKGTS